MKRSSINDQANRGYQESSLDAMREMTEENEGGDVEVEDKAIQKVSGGEGVIQEKVPPAALEKDPSESAQEPLSPTVEELGKSEGSKSTFKEASDDADDPSDEEGKNVRSFPELLHEILNAPEYEGAVHWNPEGDSFCVAPTKFGKCVLPRYFPGTKFESFTRKLNRWGFKRVVDESFHPNSIVYRHNLFQRKKPELIKGMRTAKKRSARTKLAKSTRWTPPAPVTVLPTSLTERSSAGSLGATAPAAPLAGGAMAGQDSLLGNPQLGALRSFTSASTQSADPALQQLLLHQEQQGARLAHEDLLRANADRYLIQQQPYGAGTRLDQILRGQNHDATNLLLSARLQQQDQEQRVLQQQQQLLRLRASNHQSALQGPSLLDQNHSIADILREERLLQYLQLQQHEAASAEASASLRLRLLQEQAAGGYQPIGSLSSSLLPRGAQLPTDVDNRTALLSRNLVPSNSAAASFGGAAGRPEQQFDHSRLLELYRMQQEQQDRQSRGGYPS